jgi:hypothetical protein
MYRVKAYTNPVLLVSSQAVNYHLARLSTDAIAREYLMDFFRFRLGFRADFLPLPLFLARVMISIGYGGEIGPQAHGDGTTEQLRQSTDDD